MRKLIAALTLSVFMLGVGVSFAQDAPKKEEKKSSKPKKEKKKKEAKPPAA